MPRRRSRAGRLLLASLVVALLLLALVGLLVRALSALAPRVRVGSRPLRPRRRGEAFRVTLAVVACLAALGTVAAAALTAASSATPREQAQTAQLDDGAAAGRSHWDWIRGWPGAG